MDNVAWKKLVKESPPAVCLIAGSEYGLRRRAIETLTAALGEETDVEHFGGKVSTTELADAVQTLPFFGNARLVIVEAQKSTAELTETLLELLPGVQPPNYLAIVLETLDKRTKLYKKFKQNVVDCSPLKEGQLRAAAKLFLKEREVTATPEAIERLALIGLEGLERLENAVEVLSLNLKSGAEIDGELVVNTLESAGGFDAFRFCDLITAGRAAEACALAWVGLEAGEELPRLIGLLARHYRIVMLTGYLRQSSDREIAKAIGVSPFFLSGYRTAAKQQSSKKIRRAQAALLDFDRASKSGLQATGIAFQELVYALATDGNGGWPRFSL
ncbi:DNA polymerase III subunit delta [bacterium]|nr:DNA polymerase III subunit delta [bacterium]